MCSFKYHNIQDSLCKQRVYLINSVFLLIIPPHLMVSNKCLGNFISTSVQNITFSQAYFISEELLWLLKNIIFSPSLLKYKSSVRGNFILFSIHCSWKFYTFFSISSPIWVTQSIRSVIYLLRTQWFYNNCEKLNKKKQEIEKEKAIQSNIIT